MEILISIKHVQTIMIRETQQSETSGIRQIDLSNWHNGNVHERYLHNEFYLHINESYLHINELEVNRYSFSRKITFSFVFALLKKGLL